jgi:putative SOS response-associated peptidase YedK
MAPRHILHEKDYCRWLDPAEQDPKNLSPLLVPYEEEDLTAYPISTWVNSPRNQGPQCIEPHVAD